MKLTWGPDYGPRQPYYIWDDLDHRRGIREAYEKTRIGRIWSRWQDLKRIPSRVYWFLKYELVPRHRYHWLDLRDAEYRRGYTDYSWRLPQAAFKILSEFADEEYGEDRSRGWKQVDVEECDDEPYGSKEGIQRQVDLRNKVLELLQWWNVGRHEEQKVIDDAYEKMGRTDRETFQEIWAAEEVLHGKLTEKLVELCRLRRQLWA